MIREGEPLTNDLSLAAEMRLYYDLYAPGGAPAPLLLALHGYGSNKNWMMREARQHAPEGFAVAALQGPHQHMKEPRETGAPLRYGFGWLTNFRPEESIAMHHKAVLNLISSLVLRGVARADRVFLLGFSQSCALNYRFAFTHRERLRGVVGICGGIPGDWETNPAYGETRAAVLHLSGTRDEFYTPERVASHVEQLRRRVRDLETRAYDAAHEFVPQMRGDVRAWLAQRV
jgi:predicted esterase